MNGYFYDVDQKIGSYKQSSSKGRGYIVDIDNSIYDLRRTKDELFGYKSEVRLIEGELGIMSSEVKASQGIDSNQLINPIKIENKPFYVPKFKEGNHLFDGWFKNINLIGLQTLFPKMLLLVVMFLSLLISNFICLNEINSSANTRVSIISGISIHEFLSTHLSSLIIVGPALFVVLFLGRFLFQLQINFFVVMIIMFILSTIFIMLGMSISYLVVKESIALLITTFLLLFLLFFSGYILPIERMSLVSRFISEVSPGKVALDAFNKVTFYGQVYSSLGDVVFLIIWLVFMLISTYIIKSVRDL